MIYVIFLISIIIHEFGHLIIAKCLKIHISKIKFKIIGISAEFDNENEIQCLKKVLIIIMGPFLNLLICLIFLLLKIDFIYKEEIICTNLILFSFNFLPIIPLDGGKVLFYILNLKYSFEKTFKISSFISRLILCILSLTYAIAIFIVKNVEIFFIIVYLWYIFIKEEKNLEWYIKINKNMRKYLNLPKKYAKIPSVIK